jgi:Domain of unknown function (DUF4136)
MPWTPMAAVMRDERRAGSSLQGSDRRTQKHGVPKGTFLPGYLRIRKGVPMRLRLAGTAGLLGLMMMLAARIFAQKVETIFEKDVDFGKYKTYQLQSARALKTEQPRNDAITQRIAESIRRVLNERGDRESALSPDVHIAFSVGNETTTWVDRFSSSSPSGRDYMIGEVFHSTPELRVDRKGILVLEVLDVQSRRLVWRAYCSAKMKDLKQVDQVIDKAVKKAFSKYPPKGSRTHRQEQ